ncbi:hypothetical protein ACNKHX_03070 [Shigella flexneri]
MVFAARADTTPLVEIPDTTLSALVAEQAAKHRMLRALADARVTCQLSGKCEQVVALAECTS